MLIPFNDRVAKMIGAIKLTNEWMDNKDFMRNKILFEVIHVENRCEICNVVWVDKTDRRSAGILFDGQITSIFGCRLAAVKRFFYFGSALSWSNFYNMTDDCLYVCDGKLFALMLLNENMNKLKEHQERYMSAIRMNNEFLSKNKGLTHNKVFMFGGKRSNEPWGYGKRVKGIVIRDLDNVKYDTCVNLSGPMILRDNGYYIWNKDGEWGLSKYDRQNFYKMVTLNEAVEEVNRLNSIIWNEIRQEYHRANGQLRRVYN